MTCLRQRFEEAEYRNLAKEVKNKASEGIKFLCRVRIPR